MSERSPSAAKERAAYRVRLTWERVKLAFMETVRGLLGEGRNCTGSRSCEARLHYHGCYADFGDCDFPEGHDPAASLASHPFWLDGGYDFDSVQACPHHPTHEWITVRLGDVLREGAMRDPDELMTFCKGCFVPRCGTTGDPDRCTLWRHHETAHVRESGRRDPMGHTLTGAS